METTSKPAGDSSLLDFTKMNLEDMEDMMNDPSKELVAQYQADITHEVISRKKKLKECFDVMEQLKQNPRMTITENSGFNAILLKYSKVKTSSGRFIIFSVQEAISKECWKMQEKYPKLHLIVWRLYNSKREELEPILEANKDAEKCHIDKSVNFGINNPFYHEEEPK